MKCLASFAGLIIAVALSGGAHAQGLGPSSIGPAYYPAYWVQGYVPTPFEWSLMWSNKLDYYSNGLPIGLGGCGATTAAQCLSNLGAAPVTSEVPLYSTTGGIKSAVHMVIGTATLAGGGATITLTNAAVYTSSGSYACMANDTGGSALAVSTANVSGSSFTIAGTLTDTVNFVCTGT